MVQHTDTHMGTPYTYMGEAIVLAHTRIYGLPVYAYGQPIRVRVAPIRIWAASTRMGCPYADGTAHTRMGRIPVWDGTVTCPRWALREARRRDISSINYAAVNCKESTTTKCSIQIGSLALRGTVNVPRYHNFSMAGYNRGKTWGKTSDLGHSTVTALRQHYWIPTARRMVGRLLKKCVICRRIAGRPFSVPDPHQYHMPEFRKVHHLM